MLRQFLITLALAVVCLFATLSAQAQSSVDAERLELSAAQLGQLDQAADYSKRFSGRAVLVMRAGDVVYERYDGWSATRPHMLASGTKSFTGVVAMFAVQDGLLTLDEKVADTITEWQADPQKSQITIRHLLTLSSGLDPADAAFPNRTGGSRLLGGLVQQRQERIANQDATQGLAKLATGNWFADSVRVPMKYDAGKVFDYGPSHFYAFGELLNKKLAQHDEIATKTFEVAVHFMRQFSVAKCAGANSDALFAFSCEGLAVGNPGAFRLLEVSDRAWQEHLQNECSPRCY